MKLRHSILFIVIMAFLAANILITSAQTDTGTLIIINYVGSEMIVTLDETDYRVPGTDTEPSGGVLTLQLPAKQVDYSALIPGQTGSHGTLAVHAGETVTVGARIERSPAVISSEGLVKEEPRDKLVFFSASLTAPEPTPTPASTQPTLAPIPAGQGAIVLFNYIGDGLSLDIRGELYTIPANGQLQLNLPPGEARYSASAGRSGMNGSVMIEAGRQIGLGFTREFASEEPNYEPGKPAPTPVPLAMSAFPVALSTAPSIAPASMRVIEATPTPTVLPASSASDVISVTEVAIQPGFVVVNYIGEPLTFTIDDMAYTVDAGAEQAIDLSRGTHTYTASTPGYSTNGSIYLNPAQLLRLSTTIDFQTGQMMVYIE